MKDLQITLENLEIVSRELPKLADKYPNIRNNFDMHDYGILNCQPKGLVKEHFCGTVGCMLGNTPLILEIKDSDFYEGVEFDYYLFGCRVFPYLYNTAIDADDNWEFLFSEKWSYYQPTFDQAIERIRYFIKHEGNLPEWEFQKESFI